MIWSHFRGHDNFFPAHKFSAQKRKAAALVSVIEAFILRSSAPHIFLSSFAFNRAFLVVNQEIECGRVSNIIRWLFIPNS